MVGTWPVNMVQFLKSWSVKVSRIKLEAGIWCIVKNAKDVCT